MTSTSLPAVLLAAGGSTRMGRAKQLLPYHGKTLVWHAASTILCAGFSPLIVVVGNEADAVIAALDGFAVTFCIHSNWQCGIGSSLRAGVAMACEASKDAAGLLISLADQPGIRAEHFIALRTHFASTFISASSYAGAAAVPAIFPRTLFDALMALPDDAGAKSLMQRNADRLRLTALEDFADIDEPDDYKRLTAGK